MEQVAEAYGYKVNRGGFIKSPFTNEKTASLKCYKENRGWYDFGGNTGGNVINFVQRLLNISCYEAAIELNNHFNLGLIESNAEFSNIKFGERNRKIEASKKKLEQQKTEREQKEQVKKDAFDKYLEYQNLWCKIDDWVKNHKLSLLKREPTELEYELGFKLAACKAKMDELDYLMDCYYERPRK
jgi:DNA primase